LIGFRHRCPSNSLPILWYSKKQWAAWVTWLFIRRVKQPDDASMDEVYELIERREFRYLQIITACIGASFEAELPATRPDTGERVTRRIYGVGPDKFVGQSSDAGLPDASLCLSRI
jgi:hypothetical protein